MKVADFDGALTCARYAFAPNYLHYCGPDTDGEFGEYLKAELADGGLVQHLTNFEVMYPYLKAIAQANGVTDPLDMRVVEAYWVGNDLLEKVSEQDVYVALTEKQRLSKRLSKDEMKWLLPKIDQKPACITVFMYLTYLPELGIMRCNILWRRWMNAASAGGS